MHEKELYLLNGVLQRVKYLAIESKLFTSAIIIELIESEGLNFLAMASSGGDTFGTIK